MIVDTSAVICFLLEEPDFSKTLATLSHAPRLGMGTPTLAETGIVLESRIGPESRTYLATFLEDFEIEIIPFGEVHWRRAVEAFRRYGKGRHPAGLNFGDCMTYATAVVADQPLLYIGGDFSLTDVRRA